MKAPIFLIIALGFLMEGALAQPPQGQGQPKLSVSTAEAASDQPAAQQIVDLPPDKVERLISVQSRTLRTLLGVHLEYTGILPELRRSDHPWQLLNPFAPSSYGVGYDTLDLSPGTGRGPGLVIFAIRF